MTDVAVLPLWRQAIRNLLSKKPEAGFLIEKKWLLDQFGILEPVTAEDQRRASLEFVASFKSFEIELLTEHKIALRTVHGKGYEIVPPNEQTNFALRRGIKDISRAINETTTTILNTDLTRLTDSERQAHSDGLAKAATMKSMFNRRKLLGRT